MKHTIAEYDPATDSAKMSYAPVDVSLVVPRARTYGKTADKVKLPPPAAASVETKEAGRGVNGRRTPVPERPRQLAAGVFLWQV